jgi:hypothetical protein
MSIEVADEESGEQTYQEREAVVIFDNERSLNAAVDELLQSGLRQSDMSLLAHDKRLAGKMADGKFANVAELADSEETPRTAFVSGDARTEGLAAVVGAPALIAGLGAAAVIGTGGAALIPTIAATVGSSAAGGALGLLFARAFGRKHADFIGQQILGGGLLLWVHAPDPAKDAEIIGILKRNGGRDVHLHAVTRTWGVADRPLHDFNPDPLLKA